MHCEVHHSEIQVISSLCIASIETHSTIIFFHRRCKIPSICSNDIIREVAYCYTEGSFCEEWIGNQLYQNNRPQQTPAIVATTTKPTKPARNQALSNYQPVGRGRSDFQDNSIAQQPAANRRGFLQPEYMPQELTCGIPAVRGKPKKYLYNMLRIIGGKTSRKGQWPWQVAILNRFKVRLLCHFELFLKF